MLIISQKTSWLILVSGIFFFASACSQIRDFTKETAGPVSCADLVIEKAFNLHEEAKSGLALFFDERSDNQLYQAFYAASDSVHQSRKVKKVLGQKGFSLLCDAEPGGNEFVFGTCYPS